MRGRLLYWVSWRSAASTHRSNGGFRRRTEEVKGFVMFSGKNREEDSRRTETSHRDPERDRRRHREESGRRGETRDEQERDPAETEYQRRERYKSRDGEKEKERDKGRSKERDLEREKRNREREKEKAREKRDREKEREKRDREKEREKRDREKEREKRDREKEREKRDREKDGKTKDGEKFRETRESEKNREMRDREKDRETRESEKNREMRDREKGRETRDRGKDREMRDREKDREMRDREKDREMRDRGKDREREKRDREKEREREKRDSMKEREIRDREKERDQHRAQEGRRDRGEERDQEKDRERERRRAERENERRKEKEERKERRGDKERDRGEEQNREQKERDRQDTGQIDREERRERMRREDREREQRHRPQEKDEKETEERRDQVPPLLVEQDVVENDPGAVEDYGNEGYEDDFEEYEEDFEDCDEEEEEDKVEERAEGEQREVERELSPHRRQELEDVRRAMEKENEMAYVQCNEDNVERDTQTEDTDIMDKWTQHPPESSVACGGDGHDTSTRVPSDKGVTRTTLDSKRLTRFLHSSTQVVVELPRADDSGSQTDLGLRPGGKVKLLHSSFLQTTPKLDNGVTSLLSSVLKFLPSDSNHFFIGSNMDVVVTASKDVTMRVWGSHWELLMTFVGHTAVVTSLLLCPMSGLLLSSSLDSTLRYWSLQTGDQVKILTPPTGSAPPLSVGGPSSASTFFSFSTSNVDFWTFNRLYELHCKLREDSDVRPIRQILATPPGPRYPSRVVCVHGESDVTLVAAGTGEVITVFRGGVRVRCADYCLYREVLMVLTDEGAVIKASTLTNPGTLLETWTNRENGRGKACCMAIYCHVVDEETLLEEWKNLQEERGEKPRLRKQLEEDKNRFLVMLGHHSGCNKVDSVQCLDQEEDDEFSMNQFLHLIETSSETESLTPPPPVTPPPEKPPPEKPKYTLKIYKSAGRKSAVVSKVISPSEVLRYFCWVQQEAQVRPRDRNDTVWQDTQHYRWKAVHRLGETNSMTRIRELRGPCFPPLTSRSPLVPGFTRLLSLPLPRVTGSSFPFALEVQCLKQAPRQRYFLLERSYVQT
ncbi:WD repeat-containing protein 97 isoform X1 [Silurus meridionalis]|nr:WD repeat-containing protein 97 isoform X1 [Silurus meridionalis]